MADSEVKHSVYLGQPSRRRFNTRRKNRLYETLYDLNRGFAITLEAFDRLERIGFFRRDYLRGFYNMTDEIRAWANHELTATLRDHEQREAAQLGRLRLQWEKQLSSAGDAAILKQRKKKPSH
jgi:hypothetical protein